MDTDLNHNYTTQLLNSWTDSAENTKTSSQPSLHSKTRSKPPTPTHLKQGHCRFAFKHSRWVCESSLRAHIDSVRAVYVSPENSWTCSASEDSLIKGWDFSRVDPLFTIRGHIGPVLSLTGNSAKYLFSGGLDGDIRVWDEFQRSFAVWSAHRDAIWSLVHNSQLPLLASLGADSTLKLWSTEFMTRSSRTPCKVLRPEGQPQSCAWLGLDSILLTEPEAVQVYDLATERGNGYADSKGGICIAATGQLFVSGHEDKTLKVFDARLENCVRSWCAHTDLLSAVGVDGVSIVSGAVDGTIRVWDVRTYNCLYETMAHHTKFDEGVNALSIYENAIVTGGADGVLKRFHKI